MNSDLRVVVARDSESFAPWCCAVTQLAYVCEKFEAYEQVLAYCNAGLETDLSKAGTILPSNRVVLQCLSGRAYAALGRAAESTVAFESAASLAHRSGYSLLEVYALRDLQLSVLEPNGHAQQNHDNTRRRLGAALRTLVGTPRSLNPFLKGMDVEQLMAMPKPDADATTSVQLDTVEENPTSLALQQELQPLRMFALQQRAAQDGIALSKIEEIMDSDSPRELLITALLEHHLCHEDNV